MNELYQYNIKNKPTTTRSPKINSIIKRFNLILIYKVYLILLDFDLNKIFQTKLAKITNYLIIQSPNSKISKTLYKTQFNKRFNLFYLYTIRFIAYAINRIQKKLIKRSKKYILLDYKDNSIFYLYNLTKGRVIRTNDIYFIERRSKIINLNKVTKIYKLESK